MSFGPMGISSGMDINSMVSKIVDSERVPKQQQINNERTRIDTSISAYGRLRESLDSMKNLMTSFRQDKAFAVRTVESSDEGLVSATATTEAIAGKYAIDVLQLAQSHKVASDVLSEDMKFGPGKLQVSLGKESFETQVSANSKLRDVVRGINSAGDNPGVRASIINDKEGPRLVLASNMSGEDNQIKLHVDSEDNNPLKKLEYKTLSERLKALEDARSVAQGVLADAPPKLDADGNPIPDGFAVPLRDANGNTIFDVNGNPIYERKPEPVVEPEDPFAEFDRDNLTYGQAAAMAGQKALDAAALAASGMPEDTIPGWNNTASGTLLDSFFRPELELDEKAIEKAVDIPGWSNTAAGTLTDSYVTPKEAQQKLDAEKARIESKLVDERSELAKRVERGELTPLQAQQLERAKLSPAERAHLEKVDKAQADLAVAQQSFDQYSGMTEVQAGQNSMVVLDGIAQLSSNNNVIEDAVEGIDITVKGKTPKDKPPAEIGVEYDRNRVREDIEAFVNSYNQFYQVSKDLAGVDPLTGQKGPLSGDSTVRSADSRLKGVFSSSIEDAPDNLKSLTEFGITTTRQGSLEINYDMLDRQLNNHFDKLGEFFGGNNGFAKKVEDAIQGITGVTGSIRTREKSLVEQNYRLVDDQVALDRRMDSLQNRTHSKFTAMQDATSKMQSQLGSMMSAMG
ncbi:flagellar filament capping protein FliD [Vibrio tasmaniensis]|uniref:flagellar filament capping protein FliD n=1 Tax=Vibrio tasmaniensis TaxID=212663 RepID=UPI00107F364C|nr:flagellar filament capping protein FliD [Vibrio tasmaniensis]